jgi:DNA-binding MarR family transcriptional regulator
MESQQRLIDEVGTAMQAYQRAVELVDQRAAERLGLNRTDMRCLELIFGPAPLSPGELAVAAGLTTGGVTTAIDRLERAGYATRERDAADRRRVTVRPTATAAGLVGEIYGPIVRDGGAYLSRLDPGIVREIRDFLRRSTAHHEEHAARLAQADQARAGQAQ